jgi:hypothetical protein
LAAGASFARSQTEAELVLSASAILVREAGVASALQTLKTAETVAWMV